MPVAYFKCECGSEHREIVSQSHWGFEKNERTRKWEFNPVLLRQLGPEPPRLFKCAACGAVTQESPDPKAVPTKFLFNYFEE